MKRIALAALGALTLGAGFLGLAAPAQAGGYGYGYDDGYDAPETVITRRTIVERPIVVQPRPIVREVVVERPIVVRPRPVVREVIVERPVVYRPRREVIVEEDSYYGLRRFGPRRANYGYGY